MVLAACGLTEAQDNFDKSQSAYKKCLIENAKKLSVCESARRLYEVDKAELERITNIIIGSEDASEYPVYRQNNPVQPSSWMMNQGNKTYMCNNYGGAVNCY
ncbi:MAG: hypothetical protein ACOYJ2_00975 [Rickettsiales bacterium]